MGDVTFVERQDGITYKAIVKNGKDFTYTQQLAGQPEQMIEEKKVPREVFDKFVTRFRAHQLAQPQPAPQPAPPSATQPATPSATQPATPSATQPATPSAKKRKSKW